ncbi:hypothetical protein EVAR_27189_1 [Eumeta japonica]|uniref:Uncharacterized protein n=1 Tax=Eumeta variegata TaxID=151549 RepID=A0A4C1VZJ5_EUMVA|nr:hypothetical protein EVAR_27189_1 [Eumeta japonica]
MLLSRPRALNDINDIDFGLWRPIEIVAEHPGGLPLPLLSESLRLGNRAFDHPQHRHDGEDVFAEWAGRRFLFG